MRCPLALMGESVAGLLHLGIGVETRCAPFSPAGTGVRPHRTWALRHGRGSPLGESGHAWPAVRC